jgi:hypothetical protein
MIMHIITYVCLSVCPPLYLLNGASEKCKKQKKKVFVTKNVLYRKPI